MIAQNRDLNALHPKVKELAEKLIELCKKEDIELGVSETYRTKERQDYLYAQGRTRPGNIVTYVRGSDMRSYHQWGLAFDVYQNIRGREYEYSVLQRVGALGERIGLEWGGSWSGFKDTPHFQYTFGLSINDLKNGKRPPEYITEKKDEVYEQSIDFLVKKGIINTKGMWSPKPTMKYAEVLISKIGEYLFKIKDYETIIKELEAVGVISNFKLWESKAYKEIDLKWLIKKSVSYMMENSKNEETAYDYKQAINQLIEKGIINTPDVWIPEPSVKYAPILVVKLGEYILGIKDYDKIIDLFKKNGILSNLKIWDEKSYEKQHIEWLVSRSAKYL